MLNKGSLITLYNKYKEGILYLFFGGLAFLLSLITFWLFHIWLGINELFANVIVWVICVLFAFTTNRIWVFNAKTKTFLEFIKQMLSFFGGRLFTLAIEELIIYIFITRMGFNSMVIKVIAQVVVIVLNYVISKLIIFKKNE